MSDIDQKVERLFLL